MSKAEQIMSILVGSFYLLCALVCFVLCLPVLLLAWFFLYSLCWWTEYADSVFYELAKKTADGAMTSTRFFIRNARASFARLDEVC